MPVSEVILRNSLFEYNAPPTELWLLGKSITITVPSYLILGNYTSVTSLITSTKWITTFVHSPSSYFTGVRVRFPNYDYAVIRINITYPVEPHTLYYKLVIYHSNYEKFQTLCIFLLHRVVVKIYIRCYSVWNFPEETARL